MLAELHVPEKLMPTKVRMVSVVIFVECIFLMVGRTMCSSCFVFRSEEWCCRDIWGRFRAAEGFCLGRLLFTSV